MGWEVDGGGEEWVEGVFGGEVEVVEGVILGFIYNF